MNKPETILPFMAIGRLIKIKNKETDWGWGVFLNFQHRKNNKKSNKESIYVLDVMLHTKPRKKNTVNAINISKFYNNPIWVLLLLSEEQVC